MILFTQGRTGSDFDDRNGGLMEELCGRYPSMVSLEMETFHLLDMARCSGGERMVRGLIV